MEAPVETEQKTSHPLGEDLFPWPLHSYAGKRILDILVSLALLLLTCWLFPLVAIGIKLTSAGSVFFRGSRAGQAGREFKLLKFRSMTSGTPGGPITAAQDARITPLGRILRKTKIDELPQLINVLRGDMSIVGPRPEDYSIVQECYTRDQLRVLSAPAGLTGPLQVRVFPEFADKVPPGEDANTYYKTKLLPARIAEDLEYVDQMSLWLDLKVIAQTGYCILVKSWRG